MGEPTGITWPSNLTRANLRGTDLAKVELGATRTEGAVLTDTVLTNPTTPR